MKTVLELDEIKRLVNIPQLIEEIAAGFTLFSEGRATVPPVGFLHFDNPPGDVHIKYGALSNDEVYVLKVASAFYQNPQLGLPANDGVMLVFSQKTGKLKRVLQDEGWLTDVRMAAAGAVAAKYLAPKHVHQIGIVGTGVQAKMQLEFLKDVIDCQRCVIWGRDSAKVAAMIDELQASDHIKDWSLDISAADSLDDLVTSSNLIVTTTSAKSPLIQADQVQAGTHITAMGSDDYGKQELDASLLAKADIVVADSVSQCVDHGECHFAVQNKSISEESILELGYVIKTPEIGRTNDDQITIADLTGVAIQDIQIAKMVDAAFSLNQ